MDLPSSLISQFVKITNDNVKGQKETTLYGVIKKYENAQYVQIDGSDLLTPYTSTVVVNDGERVSLVISNHSVIVTGNISSPSARSGDVEELGEKVGEFEKVVADKVSTKELEAVKGRITDLTADNVVVKEKLTATEASIGTLTADNITIKDKLKANEAEIENLKSTTITAEIADLKYANIRDLEAVTGKFNDLEANYGDFVDLTTDKLKTTDARVKTLEADNVTIKSKLTANEASIKDLDVSVKATITNLEAATAKVGDLEAATARIDKSVLKKADIDLANVNNTWIQNGNIKNGSIGDAAIHDGAITNAKIADATIEAAKIKSINADTINAGTIKTDRLIITGPDGEESIVKAMNMANGVPEAEVNSQKIQAASIDVIDLSALEARIAGFDMSNNAIYSGKNSIRDPNSGIYISTTGVGMGDGALTGKNESPLQAYADGSFKLIGKNSKLDFNTVTGEMDVEVTKLKISSKAVATVDDVNELRDEIATLINIESSGGTVFKNNQMTTTLSIVIYYGQKQITDSEMMKDIFGSGAYLQWKWRQINDETFQIISNNDPRLEDEGFILNLTSDDIVENANFVCELMT